MSKKRLQNEFEPFLNECQTYVWEWYIPEHKVRFGIPSLNRLWIDDKEKNIKLATMLERVHPDDIQKVLVRKTSPLYRSDKMFEVDLRLNVADELMPDGTQASGEYEWYGFRGKTIHRDAKGQPTYVRGVAINLDQRYRAQMKLIGSKEHQLQGLRHQNDYCMGLMQEVYAFMRGLAENVNSLIPFGSVNGEAMAKYGELQAQAEHLLSLTDKFRSFAGSNQETDEELEIRSLCLWEHLAELQQIYSLKTQTVKFFFQNPYDQRAIYANTQLLDLLIDNLVNLEHRSKLGGTVSMSYQYVEEKHRIDLSIVCNKMLDEGGMGLGVCRILAKRLWGDITMRKVKNNVEYVVALPTDARQFLSNVPPDREQDTLDEITEEQAPANGDRNQSLPQLLLGLTESFELFEEQHLFESKICKTTDAILSASRKNRYDMVFLDNRLKGRVSFWKLIEQLHAESPEMIIIVASEDASRAYHKHLRQLGAQYLVTNPITQRKVNMMVRRYIK